MILTLFQSDSFLLTLWTLWATWKKCIKIKASPTRLYNISFFQFPVCSPNGTSCYQDYHQAKDNCHTSCHRFFANITHVKTGEDILEEKPGGLRSSLLSTRHTREEGLESELWSIEFSDDWFFIGYANKLKLISPLLAAHWAFLLAFPLWAWWK